MDPLQNVLATLVTSLQAVNARPELPAPEWSALLALVGQDVNLVLEGTSPQGLRLALPSGQVITAQGELPYPDGTRLRVRILGATAEAGSLRLQTLEAQPPAPAAILAPLFQGEGTALLARLGQPDPAVELAPLLDLFRLLGTPPQPALELPTPAGLQAALETLPAPALAALKTLLQLPAGAAAAATAGALDTWLAKATGAGQPGSGQPVAGQPTQSLAAQGSPAPSALPPGSATVPGPALPPGSATTPGPGLPAGTATTPGPTSSATIAGPGLPASSATVAGPALPAGSAIVPEPAVPAGSVIAPGSPSGASTGPGLGPGGLFGQAPSFPSPSGSGLAPAQPGVSPGLPPLVAPPPAIPAGAPGSAALPAHPAGSPAPTGAGLPAPVSLPGPLGTPAQAAAPPPSGPAGEPHRTRTQEPTPVPPAATDPLGILAQAVVDRFQSSLERLPQVPVADRDPLVVWLKTLLGARAEAPETAAPAGAPERAGPTPAKPPALQDPAARALQTVLASHPGTAAPAVPETWEAWIKATVKTLSDPAASPREAPFHAAQAKEGTGFFEVPLPWAPQSPLQLWVESDAGQKDRPSGEPTQRVLLGLSFTRLGETRLGIAKGPGGLQVRVWAEHPERLEAGKAKVEAELLGLGTMVDLKIMALNPEPGGAIPSLKSLVTGATLRVLG